jgi:hypothetical protein
LPVDFRPQGENQQTKEEEYHAAAGEKGFVNRAGTRYNSAGVFWAPGRRAAVGGCRFLE